MSGATAKQIAVLGAARAVAMAWNVRHLAESARAQVVPTREPYLNRTLMMLLNELSNAQFIQQSLIMIPDSYIYVIPLPKSVDDVICLMECT